MQIMVNLPIQDNEVPDLREAVGWGRRDKDYPALFERCNFWAGARDETGKLIAFGYYCSPKQAEARDWREACEGFN